MITIYFNLIESINYDYYLFNSINSNLGNYQFLDYWNYRYYLLRRLRLDFIKS